MALLVLVLVLGLVGLAGLWALLHTGPRALCQASCWPPGPRPLPLIGNLLLLQLHKENSLVEVSPGSAPATQAQHRCPPSPTAVAPRPCPSRSQAPTFRAPRRVGVLCSSLALVWQGTQEGPQCPPCLGEEEDTPPHKKHMGHPRSRGPGGLLGGESLQNSRVWGSGGEEAGAPRSDTGQQQKEPAHRGTRPPTPPGLGASGLGRRLQVDGEEGLQPCPLGDPLIAHKVAWT